MAASETAILAGLLLGSHALLELVLAEGQSKADSEATKPSSISRLVASSTDTSSVHWGPRSSNPARSQPSI